MLLRLKHHDVPGLFVNLNLRVVGSHVTLRASARQTGDPDGAGVPRVAAGAGPNRAVSIRFSHAMALFAATGHSGSTFQLHKWVRRPAGASGLIHFRKSYLLGRKA